MSQKTAREWYQKNKEQSPWILHWKWAKNRCTANSKNEARRAVYADRGIKFYLTKTQIKLIWLRDKAHTLKRPSLDRIQSHIGYEYFNVRFIEMTENEIRALRGRRKK